MLAFNLGVFFRNLRGEEVTFFAKAAHCEVCFTGGVESLQERTNLTRHLAVTLKKGDLHLHAIFEEDEEEETEPEDSLVRVRMYHLPTRKGEEETVLLRTEFRFGDISLKPADDGGENGENGDPEPQPA